MTHIGVDWRPERTADRLVLTPRGDLDTTMVSAVRDDLVAFAVDQPRAIIIVLDHLRIRSRDALAAFAPAWRWPVVPILLVAADRGLDTTRGPSVHVSLEAALAELGDIPPLRQADIVLRPVEPSSRRARLFVRATCQRWDLTDLTPDAVTVATELVENSIIHAATDLRLQLQPCDGGLVVAVRDGSPRLAMPRKDGRPGGLSMVAYLADEWGCTPDAVGGKVSWAVLAV